MKIRTEPKPYCPLCGAQMILRKPKPHQTWRPFWGCSQWDPEDGCQGTINIREDGRPDTDDIDHLDRDIDPDLGSMF